MTRAALRLGALVTALIVAGCAGQPLNTASVAAAESPAGPHALDLERRGRWFAERGDLVRASQYLLAALDAGGPEARLVPLLMRVYVESGRYHLALKLGEDGLRRAPEDGELRLLVGALCYAAGRAADAERHLTRVLEQTPDCAEAHFALGLVLRDRAQERERARQAFRRYLALAPTGRHAAEASDAAEEDAP